VVHRSFQVPPGLPREGVTQRQLLEMHGIPRRAQSSSSRRSRPPPTPRG
jgi:hypothetical protein